MTDGAEGSGDLMVGIKTIANWLKLPVRQVFYMAEKGHLPLFKIGNKWAGRKQVILDHFKSLEKTSGKEAA
jgi:hypothetical protein